MRIYAPTLGYPIAVAQHAPQRAAARASVLHPTECLALTKAWADYQRGAKK